MEYFVKSSNPEKQRVACVVVGIFDRRTPTPAAETLDRESKGQIASVMRRGDMDGKLGSTLLLHNVPGIFADRVLLVGLGKERGFDDNAYRKSCQTAAAALRRTGAIDTVSYLTHVEVKDRENLPGNLCTPTYLAEAAQKLPEKYPIKVKVLEEADMKRLGMGSLLSVSRGSREAPKLIVLEYLHGTKGEKPVALVGKGLT